MKNSPKVFIDTNVWFSAFYRSENGEKIVKAHIDKKIKAVIDEQVLNELIRNIKQKIPGAIKPLETFLKAAPPMIIKDQLVLQAAISAKVKYLVTGNTKHFYSAKIKSKFGIQIITPAQAVKLFSL